MALKVQPEERKCYRSIAEAFHSTDLDFYYLNWWLKGDTLILRLPSINLIANMKKINHGPLETSRGEKRAPQVKPNGNSTSDLLVAI